MGTNHFQDPAAALAELRAQLEAGRVALGLNQTELARRASLGRTSVSQALSNTAPSPTAQTVGALARALRLEVRPLLDLLATASGAPHGPGGALGKPIADCNPHDLEVHPAAEVPTRHGYGRGPDGAIGRGRQSPLPSYVGRRHDEELFALVDATTHGRTGARRWWCWSARPRRATGIERERVAESAGDWLDAARECLDGGGDPGPGV